MVDNLLNRVNRIDFSKSTYERDQKRTAISGSSLAQLAILSPSKDYNDPGNSIIAILDAQRKVPEKSITKELINQYAEKHSLADGVYTFFIKPYKEVYVAIKNYTVQSQIFEPPAYDANYLQRAFKLPYGGKIGMG